ncbi:hypothetical protein GCM10025868_32800 [Angustibacter aerolatus]|uniref:Uncharacterized protein n=1 Tax=Angustibacter aerolatus TaxID=1162965 RepID=A0ABQ6JMN5_9ACTN|nr:hypothetical protein GCM10025868_32800 [Angustibacter aerolatus]
MFRRSGAMACARSTLRRLFQPRLVGAVHDHQQAAPVAHVAERRDDRLRRGGVAVEQGGQHVDAVGAGPVGERTAQGGRLHLLGRALAVVARLRAVDDATTGELRRARRALAGATGALLAVGLATATADLATGLRRVRALASRGLLGHDDLVHQRDVRLHVEDLGGQVDGAGLLTGRREDVDGGHLQAPFTSLGGGLHEHDAAAGAGDGALDEQQTALGVDGVDRQVLGGHAHVAHATGHLQALEDATGRRGATDRAGLAVVAVRTVGGADAVEAVTLHDARGALALGGADDVDLLAGGEDLDGDFLAEGVLTGIGGAQARPGGDAG